MCIEREPKVGCTLGCQYDSADNRLECNRARHALQMFHFMVLERYLPHARLELLFLWNLALLFALHIQFTREGSLQTP
jgi:hypothetical protein